MIVFKQLQKTQQTSINQCTVIQLYFCCNIHYGRDALNYFGTRQLTEFSQQLEISNPTWSDFKYPSNFGFLKKCRILSDSDTDSESVTSLTASDNRSCIFYPFLFTRCFITSCCHKQLLHSSQSSQVQFCLHVISFYLITNHTFTGER